MKTTTFLTAALTTGLAVASPLAFSNSHPISRRQEFGAVEGLPAELAAAIPTLAKSGMMPSVMNLCVSLPLRVQSFCSSQESTVIRRLVAIPTTS